MARVTALEVKAIIDTDADPTPFIFAATLIVDRIVSDLASDDVLKEIERWIAAHLVAVRDPRLSSESFGGASESLQTGQLGMGLKYTSYGQQALLLDPTGILAALDKKRASVKTIKLGLS